MQLVSKGLGLGGSLYANVRAATSDIAQGARALHHARPPGPSLPLHTPPPPPTSGIASNTSHAGRSSSVSTTSKNLAGRFAQTARTALSHFVAHLTTPGLSHPLVSESGVSWGRGLSNRVNATVRPQTIAQGLSPGARMALASRLGSGASFVPAYVPKPPGWSVTQVGLGTSRTFCSTSRPVFQHLAENVPVAVRALGELDLDVEKREMRKEARRRFGEGMTKATAKKAGRKSASLENRIKPSALKEPAVEEVEHYFSTPAPASFGVRTVLLIPLAPTPTGRVPLSDAHSAAEPRLLSLPDAQALAYSYHRHSIRVSSLFARLEAKHVWRNGASVTSHGDARGLCTLLRVEFEGWTADMVRDVLGNAGLGWCRLVEIYDEEPETRSVLGSCQSSPARSVTPEHNPAASLALPMLEVSERNSPKHAVMDPIDSDDSDAELESSIEELLTDYDGSSEASSWASWDSDAP